MAPSAAGRHHQPQSGAGKRCAPSRIVEASPALRVAPWRCEDFQARANKAKIDLSFTQQGAVRLIGDRGGPLDFLLAHDRSMLSVQSNCARVE